MPTENEKQLTAMQEHIEELTELKNKALAAIKLNGNKDMPTQIEDGLFAAYSNAIEQAKSKLATERQQVIDAHKDGATFVFKNSETYYNHTFKTQ